MVASYFLSSSLVPILSVWFLRGRDPRAGHLEKQGTFERVQNRYGTLLTNALRFRWIIAIAYLACAAALIVLVGRRLGNDIFPKVEARQLQLRFRAPTGTRVDHTEQIALQALEIIKHEVGPQNVNISLGFVGVHAPSYPINLIYLWNGGSEEGVIQVQLNSRAAIAIEPLKDRLRKLFAEKMPDVSFSFEPGDIISRVMSLGAAAPVEVAVSGPNLSANRAFAERIKERLEYIPELRDVQFGQALDYPTVDVAVDRERAGIMGVKMSEVSRSLVAATSSSRFIVPNYWADPNSGVAYQIQVQIPQAAMNSLDEARNLPVTRRKGQPVLLRNVAKVTEGTTVGQYERYNMQRMITVTANIADADLGSISRQVSEAIKSLGEPPPKVTVSTRGQVVPFEQIFDGLRTGLLLAVVVIFLLLAASYQSFKLSFVVLLTTPAVIAGVLVALWLSRTSLNIQSFMGAIMAIGVAVANSILLVTFAERSRLAGTDAIVASVDAARTRLRPILMTSLAMIAGMTPMALGLGEEQNAPLGRAVIGGLAAASLATLWVLPSIFAIVQHKAHRRPSTLDPDDMRNSIVTS
jgi:multidrug efflux pump subunit AcrB